MPEEPEVEVEAPPEQVPVIATKKQKSMEEGITDFFGTLARNVQQHERHNYRIRAVSKEAVRSAGDVGVPLPEATKGVFFLAADDAQLYLGIVEDDPAGRLKDFEGLKQALLRR